MIKNLEELYQKERDNYNKLAKKYNGLLPFHKDQAKVPVLLPGPDGAGISSVHCISPYNNRCIRGWQLTPLI